MSWGKGGIRLGGDVACSTGIYLQRNSKVMVAVGRRLWNNTECCFPIERPPKAHLQEMSLGTGHTGGQSICSLSSSLLWSQARNSTWTSDSSCAEWNELGDLPNPLKPENLDSSKSECHGCGQLPPSSAWHMADTWKRLEKWPRDRSKLLGEGLP